MKILFVQGYLGKDEPPVFPLGLSRIAASIKGHSVAFFDPNLKEDYAAEFEDMLSRFLPHIVGISIRNIDSTNKRETVFYYKYLSEMIDIVKGILEDRVKIIVGGAGFSMFPQEIMEDETRIDYGVFLEGEQTLSKLLKNFDKPETIKGIFYRKNGRIRFTGHPEKPDMNELPLPDRTGFSLSLYQNIPDAIGVETKRGCEFNCIYCIYGFLNGKQYRLINPKRVVDDIESIAEKYGIKDFMFVDSVFNIPLSHAESICKEIIERGIDVSWSAWFHDKYLADEFVQLVKEAGCNRIMLSPDALSDEILKKLGKSQRKEDILNTYNTLKRVDGIEICYNFFKNPPGQSILSFLRLLSFYIKAKIELRSRIHFEFNSMRIEPKTQLYEIALQKGIVERDTNLLYPRYYTNTATSFIERIFNMMLRLKGA
ncbi:MAG: radical SAM protein [Thermodesulfobacteriota bacterium]|nr:radical SAM protein [Thermodesulfobacteriota bacterium]